MAKKRDKELRTGDPIMAMQNIQLLATFSAYTYKRTKGQMQCRYVNITNVMECMKRMEIPFMIATNEGRTTAMVVGERRYLVSDKSDVRALLSATLLMLREEKLEVTVP